MARPEAAAGRASFLAVIAEPDMRRPDRTWIDRLRRRFDPRHGAVPAHVTLVFPTIAAEAPARARLVAALRLVPGAIRGALAEAETIRTPGPRGWYVVRRVGTGGPALARLHARLSQGPFRGHRRGIGPYRPHLTVAAGLTARAALRVQRLADGPPVPFHIRAASLVRWDGIRLTTLARRAPGHEGEAG